MKRSDDLILESLFLSADYVIKLPLPQDFELLKSMSVESVRVISEEDVRDVIELHALVAKSHRKENSIFRESRTKALIFALLMEMSAHFSLPHQSVDYTISSEKTGSIQYYFLSLIIMTTKRNDYGYKYNY